MFKIDYPDDCFQGSTDFYDSTESDEFTPSDCEAKPLVEHVGKPWLVGNGPPWIVPDSPHSPAQQYVEWFNGIWHTGDASTWNEYVFTDRAVMIDPSGISIGAKQAANNFLLLFKYFPGLRGEVVSWAANDREILINWRFQLLRKGSKTPFLVPVIDKFCFADGRVSFRLANFDILTLLGYLSQTYGLDQLSDFLWANSWQAAKTGGIQSLPGIVWNLLSSAVWQRPRPETLDLRVSRGDHKVRLDWSAAHQAISYQIWRAEALSGPYEQLPLEGEKPDVVLATTYEDKSVDDHLPYWYYVKPRYKNWSPTPVKKQPIVISPRRSALLSGLGLSPE